MSDSDPDKNYFNDAILDWVENEILLLVEESERVHGDAVNEIAFLFLTYATQFLKESGAKEKEFLSVCRKLFRQSLEEEDMDISKLN